MDLESLLFGWQGDGGRLVFLTGAGVSAESGIPTFRGADGFWTFGSKNYSAMDLATKAMFAREPETVWSWYLMRFAACHFLAHYTVPRCAYWAAIANNLVAIGRHEP